MPLYDFRCRACAHEFESLVRQGVEPAACPACGAAAPERLPSTFAVSSAERTRAAADAKIRRDSAQGHRDNIAREREADAHRHEDH